MDLIERIGAFLGLAAFGGLSILVLLYFQQAREVRRLREWAGKAPERAAAAALARGEELPEPEHGPVGGRLARARGAVASWASRVAGRMRNSYHAVDRRSPVDLRALAGIAALAAVVVAGFSTGWFGLAPEQSSGGARASGGGERSERRERPDPAEIEVAVLNGSAGPAGVAVPGLASQVGEDVSAAGYQLGEVTDAQTSYPETVVMYEPGSRAAARRLAKDLQGQLGEMPPVQAMLEEVRDRTGAANVAVVLGQDNAPS